MSFVLPTGRPGVQVTYPNETEHRRQIAQAVNRINQGRFNGSIFVTLDPGVITTVVTDNRISAQTCAMFMPQTAHAAAALATTYVVCTNGSMTISHANNGQTDRVFTVGLVG